ISCLYGLGSSRNVCVAFMARTTPSVFFRWKLLEQVRPVASDDAPYLGVDFSDIVEAFLNLLTDHLELLRAEGTAVQEFHWHISSSPPHGRRQRVQPDEHRHWRVAGTPRTSQAEHEDADR